jgi:hypothetical protein
MKGIVKRVPRRFKRVLVSAFICSKTILSVLAFKTIETALHTGMFTDVAIAGLVVLSILVPALGLQHLLEEVEE